MSFIDDWLDADAKRPVATVIRGDNGVIAVSYDHFYNYGVIPYGVKDAALSTDVTVSTPCPSCGGPRKHRRCDYCGTYHR